MSQSRLSSGHQRLDDLLGGGLPVNGINLIMGLPGSGKTILAQQYLFHNATAERPGVYLSTVSEPLEKILRYGQTLDFFEDGMVGESVIYEDMGTVLNREGLTGLLEAIDEVVKRVRPGVLVMDSFKAIRPYAETSEDFRRFLHDLAGLLSVLPVSSFWVGEYAADEVAEAPEFAVADAVVSLTTGSAGERHTRNLEVVKLRGSGFKSGSHAYRISSSGIDVFPRLADPARPSDYALVDVRISSGVPLLDAMLAEGYWKGSSTMVAGPSGAGKTLLGLHFIFEGAHQGERGIIATFQENPIQLGRVCASFGWSLEQPSVEIMYRSPVDLYVDEWVYELLDTAERVGAERLLIDSLGDLRVATGEEIRFREYVYSLLQRSARRGISVMMTQEVPDLFGVTQLSEYGISHLSDNVVLLKFLQAESEIKRAITVLKTRASRHDPAIREFDITSDGFILGEHFSPEQDLR